MGWVITTQASKETRLALFCVVDDDDRDDEPAPPTEFKSDRCDVQTARQASAFGLSADRLYLAPRTDDRWVFSHE